MIQAFVDKFMEAKPELGERLAREARNYMFDYEKLVRAVVETIGAPLDPERIQEINWGDYQGTLFFVIGEKGYQPSSFWTVKVDYGSCSGCDTLEAIKSDYQDGGEEQKRQLLELALHIVQGLKEA